MGAPKDPVGEPLFRGGATAVVTGAAGGIGEALVAAFAAEGCRVVLVDRDGDALAAACARAGERGADVHALPADVTDPADMASVRDAVHRRFGSVTVLCNNAGVMGPAGDPLWDLPFAEWERVLAVNLWGVLHGIQAFVPAMLASGAPAHVVNTASMQGFTSGPLIPEYTVSKHAVVALSESLHAQLAARAAPVRVHVLCPGGVATGLATREAERLAPATAPWAATASHDAVVPTGVELLPAEAIAARTIAGIRAGELYIFTHAGSGNRIQARCSPILDAAVVPEHFAI